MPDPLKNRIRDWSWRCGLRCMRGGGKREYARVSCPGNELIVFQATNFGFSREIETNELGFFFVCVSLHSFHVYYRWNWSRGVRPSPLASFTSATSPTMWRRLRSSTWAFRLDASPTFSSSRARIRCVFLFYLILCPLRKPYFSSRSFAVWPDRAALVACGVGGLPFLVLLTY